MKKVLVTGSNGLLGQKLTDIYRQHSEISLIATGRGPDRYPQKHGYLYVPMDITSEDEVMRVIGEHQPDCVIHTAAMTNVDACELDHEGCKAQNVDAVRHIIKATNDTGAHLIHISTDFIFDGTSGPYREEAAPNPLSFYGNSKLMAEELIMAKAKHWAILRTVLVYGLVADMSRSNIVLWARDALKNAKPIKVVDDQFRTPTLAEDLAMGCRLAESHEARGVYNISGKDYMSIYELVNKVADYFGYPMDLVERVSSSTLQQPARRPPVTGFVLDKAIRELGYQPHSFEEGIALVQQQYELFTHGEATK